MENNLSYFKKMRGVDISEHVETKKDLKYLSWAYAFAYVTDLDPAWKYEIQTFGENKTPYLYDPVLGYMVMTRVTIQGVTKEMFLPVMDGNNQAMLDHPYDVVTKTRTYSVKTATMFDINKTIMRCLVKNIAVFGLGLTLYAGDDLPDVEAQEEANKASELQQKIKDLKAQYKGEDNYTTYVKNCVTSFKKPYSQFNSDDLQKLADMIESKFSH